MYTQCPYCQTIFRVLAAHLNIAQGHVRCSHCQHVFNANNYLLQQLPQSVSDQSSSQKNVSQTFDIGEKQTYSSEDEIPELLKDDIYEYEESTRRHHRWKKFIFWSLVVILSMAILAGQIMWYWQRDLILQHPQIRPWLDSFCSAMLCVLPPTRNLNSFAIENHALQVNPNIENAIQFEAVFINNAFFAQPYPVVQLTFEDFQGQAIAQRYFKPAEYLPISHKKRRQMPAKGTVYIKFEFIQIAQIVEDNKVAVGYRFDFF